MKKRRGREGGRIKGRENKIGYNMLKRGKSTKPTVSAVLTLFHQCNLVPVYFK